MKRKSSLIKIRRSINISPAKYRALKCRLPTWAALISKAIREERVSPFPNKVGKEIAFPITIITAIVSPIALPVARTMLIRMPFNDKGKIRLEAVYHLDVPSAFA